MKKYLFIATALVALASCSDDTFVGENSPNEANGNGAISFNLNVPAVTRGEKTGVDAVGTTGLDYQFILWGEKNEISSGSGANVSVIAGVNDVNSNIDRTGHLVFKNYQVNWVNNPHSTTSNSNGWEYVGYTHSHTESTDDYQTNITPCLSVAQEIKYWDMSATNYVFTAVSALRDDIKTGKIKISKTTSGTNEYAKGYTITAAAGADFDHLYFADRNIITSGYGTSPVTMYFRNILSHIRVGVYETIPGYDVSAIKFYSTSFDAANEFKTTGDSPTSIFGATVDNLKPGANTLTVTYNDGSINSSLLNRPVVSTSGERATTITLGQNFNTLSTTNLMAKTSAEPTWETAAGAYTKVFPREGVTTDMTLKVKYTLYNKDSGETMDITGTAVVPGEYLQWKPNYKYSYIFKLTDNALTPITFDAVQVETETGSIEYITTVDNPSITTYQNGSDVTTENEYVSGKPVYVVVTDATGNNIALVTSTSEGTVNAKLYTAVSTYTGSETGDNIPSALQEITEQSVANILATTEVSTGLWAQTDANSWKLSVTADNSLNAFTTIDASDSPTGETLTINGAKFTPTAPESPATVKYYIFEYTDGDSKKHYKVIKVVAAPSSGGGGN